MAGRASSGTGGTDAGIVGAESGMAETVPGSNTGKGGAGWESVEWGEEGQPGSQAEACPHGQWAATDMAGLVVNGQVGIKAHRSSVGGHQRQASTAPIKRMSAGQVDMRST